MSWYRGDAELFVPARDVYPQIRSLERRVSILFGSVVCSWLLLLAIALKHEATNGASKGDLLIVDVPKGN